LPRPPRAAGGAARAPCRENILSHDSGVLCYPASRDITVTSEERLRVMKMVIPGEFCARVGAGEAAAPLEASRKDRSRPAAAVRG